MKNQIIFRVSLLLLLGAAFSAQGQANAHPWEIGFGGGMNWSKARLESSSSSSKGGEWWIFDFPATSTTVRTTQTGSRAGYQGNVVVSWHPNRRISLLSGLNFTSVESHALRTELTVYHYSGYSSVGKTENQIDKEYILLDVPLVFRWYLVADKDTEYYEGEPIDDGSEDETEEK